MGLLDEAIREHIELKRRHGAEPSEIAKLEQEAFGVSRAMPAPPEPGGQPHLHLAEDPSVVHPGDGLVLEDEPPRPHGDPADALGHAPVYEPVHHEPDDEVFVDDEPPARFAEPEPEPVDLPTQIVPTPPAEPEPVSLEPAVDPVEIQPTRAFDAEEVRRATEREDEPATQEHDEEGDELLEETPEFLQETPEHDRLWFEQRPPRDFDF